MKYSVHLSDTTAEETRQAILAPLREYNQSQTGPNEYRGLAIELRDAEDSIIGGLWGGSSYDWLFIQLLVVPQALRGQGVGRELMSLAEVEASSRGCSAVWLDTFEFQARSFYERLGYTCFVSVQPSHLDSHRRLGEGVHLFRRWTPCRRGQGRQGVGIQMS